MTEQIQELVPNKLPGIEGFLQALAGYYSQFLETDFKKAREPKRKYSNLDRAGKRIGMRLSKYPSLREELVKALNKFDPGNIVLKQNRHKSTLSVAMQAAIASCIEGIEVDEFSKDIKKLFEKIKDIALQEKIDMERLIEQFASLVQRDIDRHIVSPVLETISPTIENQSSGAIALEQLITYTEEICGVLMETFDSLAPTALSEYRYKRNDSELADLMRIIISEDEIKATLTDYFTDFAAADSFTEMREILSNHQISENSQIYINYGEVRTAKSSFPLYYVPVSANVIRDGISIELEPHIFVNKKAIEFIVGEISKDQGTPIPNPLSERIFYKDENESYIDVANKTLYDILIALQVEGEVDLATSGHTVGNGFGLKVTNDISISLADKSDESIVNDYEALITGIGGGSELIGPFTDIITGFITDNPISIEGEVDQEWDDTKTTDRLVFQSPLPLAEEQRKILSAIRNPKSKLIAVEGPPGTGKSHTIAAIAFEMILKGQNILILSDKKEALDVAENKLNDVIEKVRGKETEFINPILRLGRKDSNFSNIIKKSSIDKLKTSQQTFKSNETRFNENFKKVDSDLKAKIEQTISSTREITLEEIQKFINDEENLLERFPYLEEFSEEAPEELETITNVIDFVEKNRAAFSNLFNTENSRQKIEAYIALHPTILSCSQTVKADLKKYPKLDVENANTLAKICDLIEEAKWPLFGYLFSGSTLRLLSERIEKITGELHIRPQDHIAEYKRLSGIKNLLLSAIKQYGGSEQNLKLLQQFLTEDLKVNQNDIKALEDYLKIEFEELNETVPSNVKELLSISTQDREMYSLYAELQKRNNEIDDKFSKVPTFDYLKEKTQLESLCAVQLTNIIDKRVIDFAEHNRNDARTLQKIIRNKEKFPTDKFDLLRKSFPCMIAGLRDYAEFIPLKENLFDLIIIDEASQVSIAQALPALLRAKKMIVMGDRRQFGNVKTATASKALNQGYFSQVLKEFDKSIAKGDSALNQKCKVFNISNSVMDFFDMTSNFSIQLKKHFRGYPEMISFSSKYFYDESLQALKIRGKNIDDVLEFINVPNQDRVEIIKNANKLEAEVIIKKIVRLCELDEPPTVGIITPHTEQQRYISSLISEHEMYDDFVSKLKIAVFTFDTCQGEERDIIYYSMVATRHSDKLNYIFPMDLRDTTEDELDGKLRYQRMNVGFSRGKEKLAFVISKPKDEFNGAIKQALTHYNNVLQSAKALPTASDVDSSSPMEAQVLEWLKATAFVTSNSDKIEIIPQFELGAYLKALDPSYTHPNYKVDFLLRLSTEDEVLQAVIEYDGFEYHFVDDRDGINDANWRSFLTNKDIERECILESYGYKMLRLNRFNVGRDPVEVLDDRLRKLFGDLKSKDEQHNTLKSIQAETSENIQGLSEGTHKKCSSCNAIKPNEEFYDKSLKSRYGRTCKACKSSKKGIPSGSYRGRSRRYRYRRY